MKHLFAFRSFVAVFGVIALCVASSAPSASASASAQVAGQGADTEPVVTVTPLDAERPPQTVLNLWASGPAHTWESTPWYQEWLDSLDALSRRPTIGGGTTAAQLQFPYTVWLALNGQHQCTGTVVDQTRKWVLTAKHCIPNFNAIIVNDWQRNSPGSVSVPINWATVEFHLHPTLDLALVKIPGSTQANAWILAKQYPQFTGVTGGRVAGWGVMNGGATSPQLRWATVNASWTDANRLFLSPAGAYPGGPCAGDSGGPYMDSGYIWGVMQYGVSPCSGDVAYGQALMDVAWVHVRTGFVTPRVFLAAVHEPAWIGAGLPPRP